MYHNVRCMQSAWICVCEWLSENYAKLQKNKQNRFIPGGAEREKEVISDSLNTQIPGDSNH